MTDEERAELWGPAKKRTCKMCGEEFFGLKCPNLCEYQYSHKILYDFNHKASDKKNPDHLDYRHPGDNN